MKPCDIKKYCINKKINYIEVPNYIKSLKNWDLKLPHKYDFGVIVSFRYLISPNILKYIDKHAINAHPSLLPKYRGPAPMYHQIINNETDSGVSIIEIDPNKFDNGKIIYQQPFTISPDMTYSQYYLFYYRLSYHMSIMMGMSIYKVLKNYPKSFDKLILQNEEDATYAPKLPKDFKKIDWNNMNRLDIYNKWRAVGTLHACYNNKLVLLKHFQNPKSTNYIISDGKPGSIYYDKKTKDIYIMCKDDYIKCTLFQFQNRYEIRPQSFANQIKKRMYFDNK